MTKNKDSIEIDTNEYNKLREIFPKLLQKISESQTIVIIIDGLNQLEELNNPLQLQWLPTILPNNVKIFISMPSNMDIKILKRRFDAKVTNLEDFTEEEQQELISHYFSENEIASAILNKEQSGYPLYLGVLLEECLKRSRRGNLLEIIQELPDDIFDLFDNIFQQMEEQFGEKIINSLFSKLAIARVGIEKGELPPLLNIYEKKLTFKDTTSICKSLNPYVIEQKNCFLLFHSKLKEAISRRYLILDNENVESHNQLIDFFKEQGYEYFRTLLELPYHLICTQKWEEIFQLMTDLDFLENKVAAGLIDELNQDYAFLLKKLKKISQDPEIKVPFGDKFITINSNTLEIIANALNLDSEFLNKNPESLFQSLWNRCYWYDSPEYKKHYVSSYSLNKQFLNKKEKLHKLMEMWQSKKEEQAGFVWLKTIKPIEPPLVTPMVKIFLGHLGINHVAYSRDGKFVVSCSVDNTARVWDTESGDCLFVLRDHEQWVESAAFSPSSTEIITGSRDNTIRMWDMESGKCIKIFKGHFNWVSSVAYSNDGKLIASGSHDTRICVWDAGTSECIRMLRGHEEEVTCVLFNKTGDKLASCSRDKTIRLWDIDSGTCIKIMTGHTEWIEDIAFSPDYSKLASASYDKTIRLWDASIPSALSSSFGTWMKKSFLKNSDDCLQVLKGHKHHVTSVCFHPKENKLLSGSWDKTIQVWDIAKEESILKLSGHEDAITSVEFAPNGNQLISASQDKRAILWDISGKIPILNKIRHKSLITDTTVSLDGKFLASSSNNKEIRIWEIETGTQLKKITGHDDVITSIDFSPDGKTLVSGSEDKTINLWNIDNQSCIKTFKGHEDWVQCVCFSTNGKFIASGSGDKTIKLWDIERGDCVKTFKDHENFISCLGFNKDSSIFIAGGLDNVIYVWDINSGKLINSLQGHTTSVQNLFFKENDCLISQSDEECCLWNYKTGECLETLKYLSEFEGFDKYSIAVDEFVSKLVDNKGKQLITFPDKINKANIIKSGYITGYSQKNPKEIYIFKIMGSIE